MSAGFTQRRGETGWSSLLAFLLLVVGGGLLIGAVTAPGAWYGDLVKPSFNPPAWVFAPTWTLLYILIAIAGWRVWRQQPNGWAMRSWWAQLALNFAWSPVFFAAHQIGLALLVMVFLLAAIASFIAAAWRLDRVAASLFLPYDAWVTFALVLNAALWLLN